MEVDKTPILKHIDYKEYSTADNMPFFSSIWDLIKTIFHVVQWSDKGLKQIIKQADGEYNEDLITTYTVVQPSYCWYYGK